MTSVNFKSQWLSLIALKVVTFFYQRTPLHVAARKGHDYTVKCLVKKGADMDTKDKTGVHETILLIVVKYLTVSIRILLSIPSSSSMHGMVYSIVHPTEHQAPSLLSVHSTVNNEI